VVAALGQENRSLEVVARDNDFAKQALDLLLTWAKDNSVYRGATVAIDVSPHNGRWRVRFLELGPVDRESIILPDEILRSAERNVLGVLKHTAALRRLGQSTRCGVLLHGPPGTGKTLVTRYLAAHCTGNTVIVLTGQNLGFVRQACRLAKILSPSVVIMEDVDLIAGDREQNRHSSLLHDLMDEMDGLGRTSDSIFVLTSNQPESLEPALASRPGRVDQAIQFPLPDQDCRRRLLTLYSESLDVRQVDNDWLIEKTEGASPAFIQELVRRATLQCAERSEPNESLHLTTEDFSAALEELVHLGGDLTSNVLGFKPKAGFLAESE
jgi:ATP-dependent 26S proteasome regulatory subunit